MIPHFGPCEELTGVWRKYRVTSRLPTTEGIFSMLPGITLENWLDALLRPGLLGVDLGSGDGIHSHIITTDYGVHLTGIDKRPPNTQETDRLTFRRMSVEDWVTESGNPLDFVYSRRLIQQMDGVYVREHLFPHLRERVKPGGFVVLETFYDHPYPLFPDGQGFKSLYPARDLCEAFRGWHIVYWKEHAAEVGTSKMGTVHNWFHTTFIALRPA